MESASNGSILNDVLQVLHIHVPLVDPLGAAYMAQPGTDQHQNRVSVRKTAYHTGTMADLPVQPLNDIVCDLSDAESRKDEIVEAIHAVNFGKTPNRFMGKEL